MNLDLAREFLLWCMAVNFGVLVVWFVAFTVGRDWMRELHSRWFRLSEERFDAVHYAAMAHYKLGILLLNVVPYVALRLVG